MDILFLYRKLHKKVPKFFDVENDNYNFVDFHTVEKHIHNKSYDVVILMDNMKWSDIPPTIRELLDIVLTTKLKDPIIRIK